MSAAALFTPIASRWSWLAIACLCAVAATSAQAEVRLYTGEVPVTGQSEAERNAALPQALLHVLSKLSGEREISPSPALDAALASAPDMILAFGYRDEITVLPDGSETSRLMLVANFGPSAVDEVVRQLGLRRWRVERSPVVLWVVIDDRNSRELMPVEYEYELDGMLKVAEYRGLPAEWPGLSRELMAQVDVQLLWGGYTEQLVGEGTNTAGVAIVAARREGAEWQARWTFADERNSTSWRTQAPDLWPALDEGVHQLVDLVASLNALGPAGQGSFRAEIVLAELRNSDDYARSLAYFDGLSLVDSVDVLGIGPGGLRLALQLNVAPSYLETVLQQDGLFEPGTEPGRYRLVP